MESWIYTDGLADGEAKGMVRGKAEAVVDVLEGRGFVLKQEEREKILTCTELSQLRSWLLSASSIKKVADLFSPPKKAIKTPAGKKKH